MAMKVNEECINCGACEPECPNEAITEGDSSYVVDPERCTECVGAHEQAKCVEVCPVANCVAVDPEHKESKEELLARYERLRGAA